MLLLALCAVLPLAYLLDRNHLLFSRYGAHQALARWATLGLVVLGQQLTLRAGVVDLSLGAVLALVSSLVVGLGAGLPVWVAVAAGLLVAGAVALSEAALIESAGASPPVVTLLPLILVPAALPEHGARLAPPAIERFAHGSLAGWLPWLLVAYGAALLLVALRRPLPAPFRRSAALLAGAGIAALLGLHQAGLRGAATAVPVWPLGIGLGVGWLLGARDRLDLASGALAAGLLAVLLQLAEALAGLDAAGEQRLLAVSAGAVLAVGLWLRPSSARAEKEQADLVAGPVAGGDQPDLEAAPLAGPHAQQTDGL